MSPATNNGVTPVTSAKKVSKPKEKDNISKKSSGHDEFVTSRAFLDSAGAGAEALPAPKPVKPKKPRADKPKDKPARTTRTDVPKKNAQRAKGSTSLNKTLSSGEHDAKSETRGSTSSVEKPTRRETTPKRLSTGDEPRTPNQGQRRRKKEPTDKAGEKLQERKGYKPKTPIVEEAKPVAIEETPIEPVKEEPDENKYEEVAAPAPAPVNSYSFFEKIQQGVKAYFTSRSSLTPEDRNKKEGGIRTRGRVGKGVNKEDTKKRKPGLKIKNKVNNPERNLPYDQFRLNTVLGGQSSNFLTGKPKVLRHFRKLKRKKLYHPKKHYVRIQIPRKEYFYRSTVALQNPVSHKFQRMEGTPKDQEVRTPRLASARSKTSSVRDKATGRQSENEELAVEHVKTLVSEFEGGESAENFEQRLSELIASSWPIDQTMVSFEEIISEFENCQDGQNQTCAVSEKQLRKGPAFRETDGRPNWGGWMESLNTTIGRGHFMYDLDIDQEDDDSLEIETGLTSRKPSITLCHPEESSNPSLMGDIDLHLELQNYLKAIEGFHGNKNRTKTTLQCNFYDNFIPIKIYSSGQDLQNRAEEFYDVTEIKSGTSFDSAASTCAQLDEITDEMFLNVKPDPEVATNLEFEPEPQTDDHIVKAKSEDQPETDQESNSMKRTSGMTSFILNGKTWESHNRVESSGDNYDKIKPYRTESIRKCRKKSSILYKNSVYTLSADQNIRKAACDTKPPEPTPDTNPLETTLESKPSERALDTTFERAADTKPFEPGTKLLEPTLETKPSEQALVTEPFEPAPDTKLLEPTLETKPSEQALDTKPFEPAPDTKLLEPTLETKPSEQALVTEPFEPPPDTKLLQPTLETKPPEQALDTKPFEPAPDTKPLEPTLDTSPLELTSSVSSVSTGTSYSTESELEETAGPNWSPTLQELIDIYNSVLKQNNKLQRTKDSRKTIRQRSSSQLFNFLADKLKEKHYKNDLINLTRDIRDNYRPDNFQKMSRNKNSNVAEYVAMFQEILNSSLSIDQIARLNNLIFDLQNCSEKNYNRMKELQEETRKTSSESGLKKMEAEPEEETKPRKTTTKKTVRFEKTSRTNLKKKQKPKPKKEMKRIEMPPSTDLESMLKLRLGTDWTDGTGGKEKVLVKVKLSGNKVLVDSLTYFENEKALSKKRTPEAGTTELIIESVTRNQVGTNIWYKNTKTSKLRTLKNPQKQEKVKVPLKKTAKTKKPATKSEKPKPKKKKENPEQEKPFVQFEYDQLQLKSQHPMEAIAETSESKLAEDDQWKSEPPSETKILLQDIPANPAAMKEVLKAALEEKVYSKDLMCDFGWSDKEIGRTRKRIGKLKQQSKRRPTPKNKKKAAKVRSMVDLKKRSKLTKAAPPRPRTTYLCYSSVQHLQDKKKTPSRNNSFAITKTKKTGEHAGKKTSKAVLRRKRSDPVSCKSQTEVIESLTSDPALCLDAQETDRVECLFSETADDLVIPSGMDSLKSGPHYLAHSESSVTYQEEKTMELPIAFLSEATCNDGTSFLSEMIHSDSFLGNISESKLRSLFKCSSDIKFYPGRLTESGNETMPLVKFVLTPSQNERANLPPEQVEVVVKGNATIFNSEEENEEDDEMKQKSLKSIEEFINYLSKLSRKKARQKKTKKKDKENRTTEPKTQPKSKTPARTPPPVPPSARKRLYHECQRRKMAKSSKEKRQKNLRKKAGVSDVFLNKMVFNLSKALSNLKSGERENDRRRSKVDRKRASSPASDLMKQKNVTDRTTKEKGTVDVSPGFQKAVQTAIAEALVKAIARATTSQEKVEMVHDGKNRSGGFDADVKTIKINIRCEKPKSGEEKKHGESSRQQEQQKPTGEGDPQKEKFVREIDLLNSLVARESGDLRTRNSTYFDAIEEKNGGGVDQMGDSLMPRLQTAEGDVNKNAELGVEEKGESQPPLTTSDEQQLPKIKSEEIIFREISRALEEGEVSYSMVLLDDFLTKSENSDCVKLRKLLALVENKSTNIMKNMEKAAWLKVLSLLEEASQLFENENSERFRNNKLKPVKDIIDKIHSLNIRKLIDLQSFLSSEPNDRQDENVFDEIKESVVSLKQLDEEMLGRSITSEEPEGEVGEGGSGIRIHSTIDLPYINEDTMEKTKRREEERQARELKRKLRQQYICLEELMNCEKDECELVPAEIQDVKRKVAEKMKALENVFRSYGLGETTESAATSLSRATSILSVAKSYRGGEAGSSSETASRAVLSRTPGYVDLVKCLLKAWDTRLTMNTISGENFR